MKYFDYNEEGLPQQRASDETFRKQNAIVKKNTLNEGNENHCAMHVVADTAAYREAFSDNGFYFPMIDFRIEK
jgi:hypothetical protein